MHSQKMPDLLQFANFTSLLQLVIVALNLSILSSCNKSVKARHLSFANLLQLVETTWSKSVDNKL